MRPSRFIALAGLVMLIGVSLLSVGCGSSNSTKTATSGPSSSSPARATTPSSGAGGTATLTITARDFLFDPKQATAQKGQTLIINFKNDGSTSHTFSLYTDEDHTKAVTNGDSGPVTAGGTKTLTISVAADSGDLYFRCEIHPTQMSGEISVD